MLGLTFRLRKPTWFDVWQGLERAGRAFLITAVGLYPVGKLEDAALGVEAFDVDLAKKALIAGTIAALAFLWRTFLPDVGRSLPVRTADVPVVSHPHGSDVATDA